MHPVMMESAGDGHDGHLGADDAMMASTGVDQQSHLAQDHHHFGTNTQHHTQEEGWNDMSHYHQNTMPEYGNFGYGTHSHTGFPSESIQRMPPPPPPLQPVQSHNHQHHSHPQLPMLTIPPQHATWPSMLTNPNSYSSQSAPPISMPPIVAPSPIRAPHTPRVQNSQPRKTLTDDDRRRMCQVAQENPSMKQTEIGNMFGVERSTVSKVLRKKERYLSSPEDRSQSPIKRNKGKLPDVDKAIAVWVGKQQRNGMDISDEELLQQARHFAINTGGGDDSVLKALNQTWVEKFKHKHHVRTPRQLTRRASETNIPSHSSKLTSPPLGHSFVSSPTGEPSPASADRSDEEAQHGLGFLTYLGEGNAFKRSVSQSAASLNTALTDTGGAAFSASAMSPTTTSRFHFSPETNVGSFTPIDQARQLPPGSASNFSRPRSQTFPTLDVEFMNQQNSTESTPRIHNSATQSSSALESPAHESHPAPFGIDTAIASPHLHHSSSNSSMAGQSTSTAVTSGVSSTPVGSTPTSPTQEDARRAVDTLLSFIQSNGSSGFVDQNDYSTLLRLTEKLRLHQHQMAKAASMSVGGLSRIPEGDVEMLAPISTTP